MPLQVTWPTWRREAGVVRLARIFVVFVCLIILAANGWIVMRGRADQWRQLEVSNANLARAVAQQMDALFGETQNLLGNVAFAIDQQDVNADVLGRMQPNLVNAVAQIGPLSGLFIFDAHGRWVVSTQAQVPLEPDVLDRPYFTQHRDSPSLVSHIGAPFRGRSTGRWLIPVSQRLNDAYGRFAGVALATLSTDDITALLATYDVGRRGAIAVIRQDGTLLLRRPTHDGSPSLSIAGTPVYVQMLVRGQGSLEAPSPLDGERRLISFQLTRHHPVIVTVALSSQEAMTAWRQNALLQTAWAGLLCLTVAGSGAYLVRIVRRRARAEAESRAARAALEAANRQLYHVARHDGLTGLANRRHFDDTLARLLLQPRSPQAPVALLMIDVDHFKAYNDRHGHLAGDQCLIEVAAILRRVSDDEGGFAARFGGEEMAVLLDNHPAPEAVAQTIRREVAALYPTDGQPKAGVTVSIGIGLAPPASTPRGLIQAADAALYAAKREGRDRVVWA